MKTINIDGRECVLFEDAIKTVLEDMQRDLDACTRRTQKLQELLDIMKRLYNDYE